jgi:hypothetical protein
LLDGTHAYVPPLATADYSPPERWKTVATADGQQIRASGDIWALGVIACRLATGLMPLPGETGWARTQAAADYARGDRVLALSDDLAELWCELIADCLAPNPADRPDAATLVQRIARLPRDRVATGATGATDPVPGWQDMPARFWGRWRRVMTVLGVMLFLVPVGWVSTTIGPCCNLVGRPESGAVGHADRTRCLGRCDAPPHTGSWYVSALSEAGR